RTVIVGESGAVPGKEGERVGIVEERRFRIGACALVCGDQLGHALDDCWWKAHVAECGCRELGTAPSVGTFEGDIVGGVLFDADERLADEPFDIVEEGGKLKSQARIGIEPQRPLPGVEGMGVVGAYELLVEIVESEMSRQ